MKELLEYRKQLVARLVTASEELRDACLAVHDPLASLEDGWNVHQIAAHTCIVNKLVYGFRARKTAEVDNPEFKSFDSDTYMAKQYDVDKPLNEMLDDFVKDVQKLSEFLSALPAEAWSRVSRHVTLGSGLTLQSWVERDLGHIEEHLETVGKVKITKTK